MKINISTANTSQLDWLVAKCEGLDIWMRHEWLNHLSALPGAAPDPLEWLLNVQPNEPIYVVNRITHFLPQYSTDWGQGGPIIDKEDIGFIKCNPLYFPKGDAKGVPGCDYYQPYIKAVIGVNAEYGPTKLIAAMRCYVAKELGQEVDIPQDLT